MGEGARQNLGRLPEAEINNILFSVVVDILVPMNVYRTRPTGGRSSRSFYAVWDVQRVCLITKATGPVKRRWNIKLFLLCRFDLHPGNNVECSTSIPLKKN